MKVWEKLNALTKTFDCDCAYCDELLLSIHAETVAELLVYHLWMTNAGSLCQKALSEKATNHFSHKQTELGRFYTLLLSEGMKRDMCLVPYLVIRGLPSEAGMALRRAFEHAGVLAHIWNKPKKVEALQNVASRDYLGAFRMEFDPNVNKSLKALGLTKRFEVMKFGAVAAKLYNVLSGFDVHGGTGREIESWSAKSAKHTCSFCSRSEIGTDILHHRLDILTSGHKLLCGELVGLTADFCDPSTALASAAKALSDIDHDPKTEVDRLLMQLRPLQPRGSV